MVAIGRGPSSYAEMYDDDELPACEGRRFRLVAQTEDGAKALRITKREERRLRALERRRAGSDKCRPRC
jgi:hypothetical protein